MKRDRFNLLQFGTELIIASAMLAGFYFGNLFVLGLLEAKGADWPKPIAVALAGGTYLGLTLMVLAVSYLREKRPLWVCS